MNRLVVLCNTQQIHHVTSSRFPIWSQELTYERVRVCATWDTPPEKKNKED